MRFMMIQNRCTVLMKVIGATAGALLVGLVLVGGTGAAAGGGFSSDDETVGTLPMASNLGVQPGEGQSEHPSTFERPSFYLQGPPALVLDALLNTDGTGHVSYELVEVPGGHPHQLRLVFHGEVHLTIDAACFHHQALTAGVKVGSLFGDVRAAIAYQDRLIVVRDIPLEGTLPVPVDRLLQRGTLDGGVQVITATEAGTRELTEITSFAGVVEIHQRTLGSR